MRVEDLNILYGKNTHGLPASATESQQTWCVQNIKPRFVGIPTNVSLGLNVHVLFY